MDAGNPKVDAARPIAPAIPSNPSDAAIAPERLRMGRTPPATKAPSRFLVRPLVDPDTTLDLTDAVTEAIARELARAFGGNAVLNRLEAGAHLGSLLEQAGRAVEAAVRTPVGTTPRVSPAGSVRQEGETHAGHDTADDRRERQPQGLALHRIA